MPKFIEEIEHAGKLLAIIVRAEFDRPGLTFFTADELPQQLAYMHHPAGHQIKPHLHQTTSRAITTTCETLLVRRGRVLTNFYDENKRPLRQTELRAGDLLLLLSGGHGFTILEEAEIFEVKQGPYLGEADKETFSPPPTKDKGAE